MLKGPLCNVRHVRETDLPAYIDGTNDLASRGPHWSSMFQSPEAIRQDFARDGLVDGEREHFVIVDHEDAVLGSIFHFRGRTALCREIGYRLFDARHRGRGIATAAATLLVDHLFQSDHAIHRLQLLMAPDNLASERVARKCGFTHEGTLRGLLFNRGVISDAHVYGLLRPEWAARRD